MFGKTKLVHEMKTDTSKEKIRNFICHLVTRRKEKLFLVLIAQNTCFKNFKII